MALYKPGSSSSPPHTTALPGPTEFDILKASHKFLREDDEDDTKLTWEDRIAQKYYASLYREYAVCDLKHYKSGNFALRWRTEDEVISGAGETTCGNTRCPLHDARTLAAAAATSNPDADPDAPADPDARLQTLEVPFSYVEDGEAKFALVKVVLCGRCVRKLMWKRRKEKERAERRERRGRGRGREGEGKEREGRDGSSDVQGAEGRPAGGAEADSGSDGAGGSSTRERHDGDREHRRRRRHSSHSRERRRRGHRSSRSRSRSPRRAAGTEDATTEPKRRRRSRSPPHRERG